jgi:hypothetical protein
MMVARWLASILALGALAVGASMDARASCAIQQPSVSEQLSTAFVVFVGTVVYTSDANRSARVKVESIWKGPGLPAYVDVHGEAPGSGMMSASEGDHVYHPGGRYLFAPLNSSSPFLDYGECATLTQTYSDALAAYAPADARHPAGATAVDLIENAVGEYWWPSLPVLAVVVVAIALAIAVMRRREPRASSAGP